jgi:hypothetical protein
MVMEVVPVGEAVVVEEGEEDRVVMWVEEEVDVGDDENEIAVEGDWDALFVGVARMLDEADKEEDVLEEVGERVANDERVDVAVGFP